MQYETPYDGSGQATLYTEPDRTSLAAILSLVLGLLGCCVGVTAVFGVVLAIVGILGIARSQGRVGGMGFAVAGLIISILTGLLWIGLFVGASIGFREMDKMFAQPVAQVLLDLEQDDFDSARATLGGDAAAATDEELIAFREGYMAIYGSFVSKPSSIMGYIEAFSVLGPAFQGMQPFQGRNDIMPVPMLFDNGTGLVLYVFDQQQMNTTGQATPMALHILGPNGEIVSLPPDANPTPASTPTTPATPDGAADTDADADDGDAAP